MGEATRFAEWTRGQALTLLAFTAILLLAAALLYRAPVTEEGTAPAPAAPTSAPVAADERSGRDTDLALYDVIIERVAAGENYYAVAVEEQRARNFPVRPGFAVRLPTLAIISAAVGLGGVWAMAAILGLLLVWAWWRRLSPLIDEPVRRVIAVGLVLLGIAVSYKPIYFVLHELWSGVLLAIALALHRPGKWFAAWVAAALALAIREHALPFVLLMGALALWRRDWREAGAWVALALLFLVLLAIHVGTVAQLTSDADQLSPSWLALRGPQGWLESITLTSGLYLLPAWLGAPLMFLPLLGWAALKERIGLEALLLFAGYGLLFMIAGRENNFYWGLMVVPAWFVGLYWVPAALRDLVTSARKPA